MTDFDAQQATYWFDATNLRRYDHPVVRAFAEQRVSYIGTLLAKSTFGTALEVGCGDGFGMMHMRPIVATIHGCDKSPGMLAANPADPSCLRECDAYDLPYPDNSFDLVYCWELLHHVGEPQTVVSEMARVARQAVLLCEPNGWNPAMALFALLQPEERGLLRFGPSYPARLLTGAGLKCQHRATIGWFTPNRTPGWLAAILGRLPYRVPCLGLYSIALGFKECAAPKPARADALGTGG